MWNHTYTNRWMHTTLHQNQRRGNKCSTGIFIWNMSSPISSCLPACGQNHFCTERCEFFRLGLLSGVVCGKLANCEIWILTWRHWSSIRYSCGASRPTKRTPAGRNNVNFLVVMLAIFPWNLRHFIFQTTPSALHFYAFQKSIPFPVVSRSSLPRH